MGTQFLEVKNYMKKSIFICFIIFSIFTTTSCNPNNNSTKVITAPLWENKEENAFSDECKTKIDKILQSNKITKVEYNTMDGSGHFIYPTQDSVLIERWRTLISKLNCRVVPFEIYWGGGAGLTFYEDEIPKDEIPFHISITSSNGIISITNVEKAEPDYMLQISNYNESKNELFALISDMEKFKEKDISNKKSEHIPEKSKRIKRGWKGIQVLTLLGEYDEIIETDVPEHFYWIYDLDDSERAFILFDPYVNEITIKNMITHAVITILEHDPSNSLK